MTIADLAHLLTLHLKAGGERKLLRCSRDISDALGDVVPESGRAPFDPWALGAIGNPLAMLTGIDVVIEAGLRADEWKLVRAADDSVISQGTLAP